MLNHDLYVCFFMHLRVRRSSRGPNKLYVYEPQQNLGLMVSVRKTDLSPLPNNSLLIVPRKCFCCGLFQLSAFVRFLFVFDVLFAFFRTVLWQSAGKELSSWLSVCAILYLVPSFLFLVPWFLGQGVESVLFVSVPDHLRFIYYVPIAFAYCLSPR